MKKWICAILSALLLFNLTGCETLQEINPFAQKETSLEDSTLEEGILKVGMYMHNPPMASVTEDTVTPVGFEVELAQSVGASLGLQVELVDLSQENLLPALNAEMVDCVISSISATRKNGEKYGISNPYADLSLIADQLPEDTVKGYAAIYTAKENESLLQYLNTALETLEASGDLSALSEAFFEMDITNIPEDES